MHHLATRLMPVRDTSVPGFQKALIRQRIHLATDTSPEGSPGR